MAARSGPATGSRATYLEQVVCEIRRTPEEYLPNLLEIVRLFRDSVSLKPAEASFRQGWTEAAAGEARSVCELWQGIGAR